ncbi:MAG TPA: ATP-grasp domain-containing protein [Pseudonocardiaceae bacterium]
MTIPTHVSRIPAATRHVEVVENPDDLDAVLAAATLCQDAEGKFDMVLALSEFNLLTGAEVRESLNVPGRGIADTLVFRDKVEMKRRLRRTDLPIPEFDAADSVGQIVAFRRAHPGPVVVKPRSGAASTGCFVIQPDTDPAELLADVDLAGHDVEEYVPGPIWHVDGLMSDGVPLFFTTSRYINNCYQFSIGRPLGSVVRTGPEADRVSDFAFRCLSALGLDSGAFHIEIIEAATGLTFLEVGARVGGGEIPFVSRDVYGVDLIGDWIRIELGMRPRTLPAAPPAEHAGFLMLPEPVGHTLRSRTPMLGRIPHLYDEVLPPVGHVFDGNGGYETILGRFRYRGADADAVESAIRTTIADYSYVLTENA